MGPEKPIINRRVHKVSEMSVVSDEHLNQRVKTKRGKLKFYGSGPESQGRYFWPDIFVLSKLLTDGSICA